MYSLATFSLHDMTECGAALRNIGVGATSLEEVVQRMVQYLYANLGDRQTGVNHCALVRLFLTRPYGELDADCRRCAQEALGGAPDSPSMPCLALMGTAGERPEWNDTKNSRRYRAVPLPSEQFVAQFPMFAQLLKQLGVETQAISNADSTLLADHEDRTYNVFHVPEVVGNPFIPVQESFVIPFGVRSALGFGGLLPSGQLFAVIMFSKVHIPRKTAELFKTLALSAKLALLPFDVPPRPNGSGPDTADLARMRSELTTLRRLLQVQQHTVAVQTARLDEVLNEVRLRAQELEESQKDLRRQTRLFESMLRGMAEGVVVTDLDGQVLLANEVAKRVLGLSLYQPAPPVESTGDRTPEPKDLAQAGAGRVPLLGVLQGKVTGVEVNVDPGAGIDTVWLSVNTRRLRDDRGQMNANLLVFHDITSRKQAEEALKRSEERFGSFVRSTDDGIVTLDRLGLIIFWNPGAEKLFGYTQDEVLGKPMTLLMPERFRERHERGIKRASAAGHLTVAGNMFELVGLRKDGTEFPHELSLSSWSTRNGVFFTGIIRDITERTRAEEMRARLAAIIEGSDDAIFGNDLDGIITSWNQGAQRLFGYTEQEVIGRSVSILFPPDRKDEKQHILDQIKRGQPLQHYETVRRRKDGSLVEVSITASPIKDSYRRIIGASKIARDITERKRAEERVQAILDQVRSLSARLETVREEERARIARELHDELGVRLTCFKMDLARVRSFVPKTVVSTQRAKLDEKLHSMTAQVDLTIGSVQRIVTELRPGILDDLGLVAAIEWQCQDFQMRTGIPCTCVTSTDDIAMDAKRATALFRICQEALTNTARHAQATAATVKLESWNNSLRLVVADNGLGIPDTKASDRQSLGLLGMQERVALFGGEITIQGNPGNGTTITVWLPHRTSTG